MEIEKYRVYLGPMPGTLGNAHTYWFQTEELAREFAAHSKRVAWADHQVDRKVTVAYPEGFTVSIELEE